MSDVKKIFSEKKFPSFITSHAVFKKFKEIKKVFPEIGLPNTEKEIEVDNKKEAQTVASALLVEMHQTISERLRTINKFAAKKSDMGPKRKKKLENATLLLTSVKNGITKSRANFFIVNNGRITINLPFDVSDVDDKVAFKSGEGMFRVYNKLNEVLREGHFLAMEKLENLHQFKEFSAKNVPSLKYKIRFSSDGSDGAWDIATMSMRGVSSCQSWGTGNSSHIVGSLVDPFTAILYLTSGTKFNEYGSKMIRRCVVRFVVDEKKKVPFLALERMYPSMERGALDAFISFMKERTDNKFDVVYLPESCRYTGVYVPMSKVVSTLTPYDQPYRDSGMTYKADINKAENILEQIKPKIETICTSFASKIVATARAMKLTGIPAESKSAFKSLRGSDYMWDASYHVYDALVAEVKEFFNNRSPDTYTDPGLYMKDALEALLTSNLEDVIFNTVSNIAKTKIPKNRGQIGDEVLRELSKTSAAKLVAFFGLELKKIKIVETKAKKKDPAESIIPIYTKLLS